MVGAVVLDADGGLAGEGYHRLAGRPHAEQEALEAAGERAKGGTLYVNLEPWTHAHREPHCAQSVGQFGARRGRTYVGDPVERVQGDGNKVLPSASTEA